MINYYLFKYLSSVSVLFSYDPELAIDRIKVRVRTGGHFVPDQDVRRRFYRGKKNFWNIYRDLADYWEMYYNGERGFIQVVTGEKKNMTFIDETLFELFKRGLDSRTSARMTLEAYERLLRITQIGNRAVRKVQEENRKKGIPNVYARNGKPYYEMPDGTITTISPFT